MPLQRLADDGTALQERIAELERTVAVLQRERAEEADARLSTVVGAAEATPPVVPGFGWPHMADNIFLGLVVLIAAHWLATSLPLGERPVFRLVALVVALPFGYRFECHARRGVSMQVIAALAYGTLGTVALGLLDMALGNLTLRSLNAPDAISSLAAIALSHFAGSGLAQARQLRADRAAHTGAVRAHLEPARIKSTAEAVKAMYDAVAPIAAGSAAVWAAFHHVLF